MSKAQPRGTSNGNERGNNVTRKQRKLWLLETYAADVTLKQIRYTDGTLSAVQSFVVDIDTLLTYPMVEEVIEYPTARCYRCGCLLWMETVTVDRIKPGCFGGRYRTPRQDNKEGVTNVRPACALHNSSTGGALANGKQHKAAKTRARKAKEATSP